MTFNWDVFLSHNSLDKPKVARLADRLKKAGFKVWFDDESIAGGEDISAAVEEGLEQSRVLLLCMTPAAFESEWVRLERHTALFRDPSNRERRFSPVLFEDCRIPALLRRFKYIDYRDESEAAFNDIVAALKPDAPPVAELPRDQWNPFEPYWPAVGSYFVGRKSELRRMQETLERGASVSVVGDWRIGKTSLLLELAERLRPAGRVVRCLSGERAEGGSVNRLVSEITGRPAPDEVEAAADQLREWAVENKQSGMSPVLIIDECETLIRELPHRFFERVRGMLDQLAVVLCTCIEIDRVYESLRRTSPFHNTLRLERVGLLDEPATQALIGWSNGLLTSDDQSLLREWAGCHPYYLQLLGYELADARLHAESTDEALQRFKDAAAAWLRELWKTLSDKDCAALEKLVSGVRVERETLKLRGIVQADGTAFGRVLIDWLKHRDA